MDKLCGTLFVFNGRKFDYCFTEAMQCLLNFCDYVVVVAGGEDGTMEYVLRIAESNKGKVSVIEISPEEWEAQTGKEKLNYFTNVAIEYADKLGFQYQFNLQADEIVHESSYSAIREAISEGAEGYMCRRVNLWASPYMQLDVQHTRLPCSNYVIRLSKVNYRSYDDAESIGVNNVNTEWADRIRMYHMGFVRNREVMKSKIINMQEAVFGVNHDPKLDQEELFNPDLWIDPQKDLKPIDEPLPLIIQDWAKERVYVNK
jgi:hypothetical protein